MPDCGGLLLPPPASVPLVVPLTVPLSVGTGKTDGGIELIPELEDIGEDIG